MNSRDSLNRPPPRLSVTAPLQGADVDARVAFTGPK